MVFRLISLFYRLLPGDATRKEAVKSLVYSNFGSLFGRSHNYAEWLRLQKIGVPQESGGGLKQSSQRPERTPQKVSAS